MWDNIFAAFDPSVGALIGTSNGTHFAGKFQQIGTWSDGPPDVVIQTRQ